MQDNIIVARGWTRGVDSATTSISLEVVCLFSLLGLLITAAVLLGSSPQAVEAITAALLM